MYELSITGDFASAHLLRGYDGHCKDLHGHTWKVEVTIQSESLNPVGLVIDFRDIKSGLKAFLSHMDHIHLNDLPPFDKVNPSTENIARYIYDQFAKECHPLKIRRVRVWESDSSSVTYFE